MDTGSVRTAIGGTGIAIVASYRYMHALAIRAAIGGTGIVIIALWIRDRTAAVLYRSLDTTVYWITGCRMTRILRTTAYRCMHALAVRTAIGGTGTAVIAVDGGMDTGAIGACIGRAAIAVITG